jgi:hypothetical protein
VLTVSSAIGRTAPPLAAVIPYVLLVVVGAIILQTALAILTPRAATAPADERERQIQLRAGAWSGVILGVGVMLAMGHFLARGDGAALFHLVAVSLIVSQLAEYGIAIVLFRRGV